MRRHITRTVLALTAIILSNVATADGWRVSGGLTTNEGAAVEGAYQRGPWEVALGYAGSQDVNVNVLSDSCRIAVSQVECGVTKERVRRDVDDYLYLSFQRLFEWRRGRRFRPVFGLGAVGQSDTNAYVSSYLNFSLSVGLNVGERALVQWRHFSNADLNEPNLGQDIVLLSWRL